VSGESCRRQAFQRGLLVITELFLPTKGGTAVWFDEVYRRIGGREIHIVTRRVAGSAEHDADHPNTVHRLRLERSPWLRPESLAMYARLLGTSLRLALARRFDAVHAGRVLPEGLIALAVARLIGRPCIVYAHGEEITTWRQPAKFCVMRWVYRRADRIIANSEFTRDELRKLDVPAERIVIIHPGVDTARFRPGLATADLRALIGLQPDERLIVSVGRLSRRKGFDQLVRALPLLAGKGVRARLAIAGIGEDEAYLKGLAAEMRVSDRVYLLGHVEQADLPRWLNAADVFAMPNREIDGDNEGFGMVFLEAAACGKPAVAGRDGGTGAAVVDGVTGVRVDGKSAQAVAEALRALLGDDERLRAMGKAALHRAQADFSWDSVAARTIDLQLAMRAARRARAV
jgi:phosphatidylinositol alpha-1,6-mannosyltransferase